TKAPGFWVDAAFIAVGSSVAIGAAFRRSWRRPLFLTVLGAVVGAQVALAVRIGPTNVHVPARGALAVCGARKRIMTSAKITFSVETIRVLQFAVEEADRVRHNHIGTEHLLLGVLSEPDSAAATMLTARGITSNGVRDELAQLAD